MRRIRPADWAPFSKAFSTALARRGYPLIEDCNADFRDGLVAVPMNNLPGRRVSASMAYLTAAVRRRTNLTVLPDSFAEWLIVHDGRARGVAVRTRTGARNLLARETIVSCGALLSPALLMRSGIGPGSPLRTLGIDVVRALPGVGRNLQNKLKIELAVHLPRASVQPDQQRGIAQNLLRYSSGMQGCTEHDMGLKFVNKTSWHRLGQHIGAIAICLHKPYSQGSVELTSADPSAAPRIRFNELSDSRDFERLVCGLRFALELLAESEVALVRNEVFLPDGKIGARIGQRTRWNALQASVIDLVLANAFLRRALLKSAVLDVRALAQNEEALRGLVRRHVGLGWHVCGTCKIGRAHDPDAVVDAHCRVHGVDGLRVVDASVFPTAVGEGGMHLAVLMIAEKMSDHIKADWRTAGVAAA